MSPVAGSPPGWHRAWLPALPLPLAAAQRCAGSGARPFPALLSAPRPRLPLLPSPGPRGGQRPRGLALPGWRRGPAGSAPPPPAGQGTVAWRACRGSCCCCCCWGSSTFSCPLRSPTSAAHSTHTAHTHTLAGLGVGGAPHFVCSAPCPLPPPPPNNNKPRRESRRIPTPFPHKGSTPWGRAGGQPTGARIAPTRSPPGGCGHGLCPPWTTFGWWEPSSPLTSTPIKKRDKISLPQPSCPKTRSPQRAPSPPGAAPVPLTYTQRNALQGKRFPLALLQLLSQLSTALPLDLGHVTLHSCVKFKGGIACSWSATAHNRLLLLIIRSCVTQPKSPQEGVQWGWGWFCASPPLFKQLHK